ncbi:hypothetical protein Y032_0004g1955 [Ancylostoma ceylanicum]|uniref:Uncharacterized protein n=1 Tax=Ancylostoma ceylanicum TaxID=53326 RepID=A0A016VWI6_9BILA|nr:hypothetical protein Y032_0004g1955 [Ancylostoma ceylanicum]
MCEWNQDFFKIRISLHNQMERRYQYTCEEFGSQSQLSATPLWAAPQAQHVSADQSGMLDALSEPLLDNPQKCALVDELGTWAFSNLH